MHLRFQQKTLKKKTKQIQKQPQKALRTHTGLLPDHPASCSQCFNLLDSYKQKVLDLQKDKCHHQLQLWM